MGRPLKVGLDYFPLDVAFYDDSVDLLEAECGLVGFAILIKLWQKIYSNGYFIEWSEDAAMLFSRKINSGVNEINSVINVCLRRNLLNNQLYEKYGVLTSKGIQKRYFKACADSKRKNIPAVVEYFLLSEDEKKLITEFTQLTPEESTQRKGEEKKGDREESKGEDDSSSEPCSDTVKEIVEYLNEKTGKAFKPSSKKTKELISARLNDGYTIDDFKKVIDVKTPQWINNPNMVRYLQPTTLFSLSKFEGYLQEWVEPKKKFEYQTYQGTGESIPDNLDF